MTYAEAKAKALKHKKDIDSALEYKGAYVFYNSKVTGSDTEDNDIVILKSNGNVTNLGDYVTSYHDEEKPKKLKF